MSIPSARRPQAALSELKEKKRDSLKVNLKKEEVFLNSLGQWCENLTDKQKKRLTRKILLRRALYEAYRVRYDIDYLPKDWLKNLLAKHNVILYKKKKNLNGSSSSKTGKKKNRNAKDDCSPPKAQGTARTTTAALLRLTGTDENTVKEENMSEDKDTEEVEETMRKEENGAGTEGKPKPKKMIDLSNEPPPGWWLQAYTKGIVLPRLLQICSTSTQNIIFWDYEVEPMKLEGPEKYEMRPHDRLLKFDWWAKETKEKVIKRKLERTESSTPNFPDNDDNTVNELNP